MRVEPPAADHVAAGRRHARRGRSGRAAARRAGTRRGSGCRAPRRARLRRAGRRGRGPRSAPATRRRRRCRRAARPSSRRRGSAGRSRASTGSAASSDAARIGSAPFLFPAARTRPLSGLPPSMTKDSAQATRLTATVDTAAVRYPTPWTVTRDQAWETLTQLHEERGAAAATRSRSRPSSGAYARKLRRGRGALARRRAAPRLRLRDPPDARQAPAGRRADPARGGLPGGGRSRRSSPTPSTSRCRATRR